MKLKQTIVLRSIALVVAMSGFVWLSSPVAMADCAGAKTAIINCTKGAKGSSAITDLLLQAIQIMTIGVGIAAVGGIVYAAIIYTTAEDKAAQVTKAKMIIFNVVLGIIAYFLMYAFLQFLIPGGAFTAK